MSAHRMLYDLYRAGRVLEDEGDAGTLTVSQDMQVCPMVSAASAETRTLSQPTKSGLITTLAMKTDGGGDITVTVTGGYNADGDTAIVFSNAGEYVRFVSIDVGGSYYWRVVGNEGTDLSQVSILEQDAEHGPGAIGTGVAPSTYRYNMNGSIITEIKIDLTGLGCKGSTAKDAIGLAAGGAAYIGRYVTATYGIVYRVEMACLELPGEGTATITTDIDLGAEDVGTTAYDVAVDDIVINTGGVAAGQLYSTDTPSLTANDYLYLIEGDTTADTGVYDGGQLLIRFYGHPLLT